MKATTSLPLLTPNFQAWYIINQDISPWILLLRRKTSEALICGVFL
jgi:hypothetical protein